jgi:hypothetical protein
VSFSFWAANSPPQLGPQILAFGRRKEQRDHGPGQQAHQLKMAFSTSTGTVVWYGVPSS